MNNFSITDITSFLLKNGIGISLVLPASMPGGACAAATNEFLPETQWYAVHGFYKGNFLYLCEDPDEGLVHMNKDGLFYNFMSTDFVNLEDAIKELCEENIAAWEHTKSRYQDHAIDFDPMWLPLLVKYEFVKVTETIVRSYSLLPSPVDI